MRGSTWSSNNAGSPATLGIAGKATVCVPVALLNYLARRCDTPDDVIARLLRLITPGRNHVISSTEDVHLEVGACALKATTVITVCGQDVEACIIGKDWTVHAGPHFTDLTLARLPHALRASSDRGLLSEKFDIAFLPRELKMEEILERGPGGRVRCQAVVTGVALTPRNTDQGLDDVWGAVSGSDGAS